MNLFAASCSAFELKISLTKTKVMFNPVKGEPYIKPTITIHGTCLDVVESFTYLGSTLTCDGSLDAEIHRRIQKASVAYGTLAKRLWSSTGITHKTKLNVYRSCVLSVLLYSSETWTLFRRHLKILEHFHQKCLRRILNIKWNFNTPNRSPCKGRMLKH